MSNKSNAITKILKEYADGDGEALHELLNAVYDDIKAMAQAQMKLERKDHTLQPSALVNEAFLRLVGAKDVTWQDRTHFFALAATMMRRILVDHARNRNAKKRGDRAERTVFNESLHTPLFAEDSDAEIVALNKALTALEKENPRRAKLVELRYFSGLTIEQTAFALDCSVATVKREWLKAKAWLYHHME